MVSATVKTGDSQEGLCWPRVLVDIASPQNVKGTESEFTRVKRDATSLYLTVPHRTSPMQLTLTPFSEARNVVSTNEGAFLET